MTKQLFLLLCFTSFLNAQNTDTINTSRYLEDQIYIGLSFITLTNLPDQSIEQNGFSNSFGLGFIKDIPVNNKGNIAFGVGLGYGRSTYFQNIRITEEDNINQFQIVNEDSFKNNKFSMHSIDIPLEFRLRTSTIDKYKFWRLYAGAKLSYVFESIAKYKENGNTIKVNGISEINNLQFGLSVAFGYGTWNFSFYYGLTDIFSNAYIDETVPIEMRDFKIGLIFYVL